MVDSGDKESVRRDPAFRHVDARWQSVRTEYNLRAARGKIAVRRKRRALAAVSAGIMMAAAGGALVSSRLLPRETAAPAPLVVGTSTGSPEIITRRDPRTLSFADGSSVRLRDEKSHIEVDAVAPTAIELRLTGGQAQFDIAPDPARTFVVRTHRTTVRVLGTSFQITREEERTHVSVSRGRVQVDWPGGSRALAAGESSWFDERHGVSTPVAAPGRGRGALRARFAEHSRKGEYVEAYRMLTTMPEVIERSAEDLLLAADAARLSGHASAAVPFLERAVKDHPGDARAPLAAFTLGRVLLSDLDRPHKAADAFALTRKLAPQGALAEDALAREIESAARAGAGQRVRRLAREYLTRYPSGRRVEDVRRLDGR